MIGKREAKREDLRKRLHEAATRLIVSDGVGGLNARNLTKLAGCALGSLYTAYEGIDDVIVHVNSTTLAKLGDYLLGTVEGETDPTTILKKLAMGYWQFARDNTEIWNALFTFGEVAKEVPEWHEKEQEVLVTFIAGPVGQINPALAESDCLKRSKTMFAAVHGIVSLSLHQRFIGLREEELAAELDSFIDQMVLGLSPKLEG